MRLMSNEIKILVLKKIITYILPLVAAFIAASAENERIFLVKMSVLFRWMAYHFTYEAAIGNSGFLKSVELVIEDLLVFIEDPGCAA